ncbi:uncharacterized protein LOC132717253 [Ruditapes philippinarum]|uniref:uncharacterized protein LOC132717253 n=1 Tax=Ruditapes philippinarum TaxID=129788 RepID=UPI00295B0CA8|nr:uncharacterized protein LOC132717253 [Ruditapes philippinarum]
MELGIRIFVLLALIQGTRSAGNIYILPSLGLGGDGTETNVKITFMIANPGPNTIDTVSTTLNNDSVVQTVTRNNIYKNTVQFVAMENFEEGSLLNRSELANKSITVETLGNGFNLHIVYEKNGYDEGYAALATSEIGNEYYVSTFCALGGFCQVAIASVSPGLTRVYIKLPSEVDEVVICVGEKSWRSKYHTSFNLTFPETIQIETTHDLTGTFIYADKPVSVIAGTRSMPADGTRLLHFMEQLTPVPHWGTEFIVRGFETAYGVVIHITSSEPKTFVEMSGFKTVEMTGNGQTLKRRLEESTVSYIKSTKPVQVIIYVGITFGSYDPIYSVGMTTVPAFEHFLTSYVHNANNQPTFFQYVLSNGDSVPCQGDPIITKVPYTPYQVNSLNQTATLSVSDKLIKTGQNAPFGGIVMINYAVFPLSPPLILTGTPCGTSVYRSSVGDGIDNDCDGNVDEDYCFENAKITSTFIPGVTDEIPAYTANVTDFYELLFRVQTCETVQIELSETAPGKFIIYISWSHIIVYRCFPKCDVIKKVNTSDILDLTNCKHDVISYWVMQSQNKFCVDIGRRNFNGVCAGIITEMPLSAGLVSLRVSGLMNNATIWYDMYRTDCGKFASDWRCQDTVANCNQYPDDLCTNPSYTEWVNLNCQLFCGICSPDSHGRMFVYHPAPWTSALYTQYLKIVGSYQEEPRIGVESGSGFLTSKAETIVDDVTNVSYSSFLVTDVTSPVYIFAEDDSIVYSSFEPNGVNSRLLQPLDAVGNEYMTISFGSSDLHCSVASLEPGTSVNIYTGSQILTRDMFKSFSETFSTFQTGTLFTGNKPFALFCGTDAGSEFGMTWFQVPATKTWGTSYITPAFGFSENGEMRAKIKIVANSNNTVLEIHGDFDGIYVLLSRGDSKELVTDPSVTYNITSNFPVGVAILYLNNPDSSPSYTASFHILSPVESFMDNPVMLGYSATTENVTATDKHGTVTEVTLNNTDATLGDFYYSYEGLNTFLMYARILFTGIDVTPSTSLYKDFSNNQICRLKHGTDGDGTDADCDGLADEESVCYFGYSTTKQDSDLDGAFGEDCGSSLEGTPSMLLPEEPQCTPQLTEQTNASCWQNCACRCSWQTKLEEYQLMNKSEQDAYNQAESEKYQKELKVNEKKLSSHVAGKQSAVDTRTSSQNIGVAGVVFIIIVVCVVMIFDLVNLIHKIRGKKNAVEEVQ